MYVCLEAAKEDLNRCVCVDCDACYFGWGDKIDAATFSVYLNSMYMFKGDEYVRFHVENGSLIEHKKIKDHWVVPDSFS